MKKSMKLRKEILNEYIKGDIFRDYTDKELENATVFVSTALDAMEEYKIKSGRWIPVEEHLPKIGERVDLIVADFKRNEDDSEMWFEKEGAEIDTIDLEDVTHWREKEVAKQEDGK